MGTLIILAILVLVVLGFNSPVWWLAAAALIYLYVRYVRPDQGASGSSSAGGGGGAGGQSGGGSSSSTRVDSSYHAYRQRRDRLARWERRYRRERPWNVKK
ncbi:hypothetical protein GCM10010372_61570 [Streptomyces tauricus]|uniref:Secreted protein n=1 Tax=Streptomyces tauricus TaxID=68274 RepID=A0ABZ1JLG7_9ACTN|nr:hypothetical protein [Streptomyces tauricus]MCW8101271.1 hypothetical protein [Streptomyces tauricus]GHA53058.1 hypothetical protein GCM10010372_61570 [Streptomyces tauricus]